MGSPKEIRFRTRHELSLEMRDESGDLLPHKWVAGDDEMGRCSAFRSTLRERQEQYLLAVPSNTTIRDLECTPAVSQGRGVKRKAPFQQVAKWRESVPEATWTKIDVCDGEKRIIEMEIVKCRVQARTDGRRVGPEETLVVTRTRDEEGNLKHDYYLSNAPYETELQEFARVATAAHRIEECIKRGKSEAGMADYEVRTWHGWYHHQVITMLAIWFLILETGRGQKNAGAHPASASSRHCDPPSRDAAKKQLQASCT
jgi:SRSO17 transposase